MTVPLKVVQGTGSCFDSAEFAAHMFLEPRQAVATCCLWIGEGLVPHDADLALAACSTDVLSRTLAAHWAFVPCSVA